MGRQNYFTPCINDTPSPVPPFSALWVVFLEKWPTWHVLIQAVKSLLKVYASRLNTVLKRSPGKEFEMCERPIEVLRKADPKKDFLLKKNNLAKSTACIYTQKMPVKLMSIKVHTQISERFSGHRVDLISYLFTSHIYTAHHTALSYETFRNQLLIRRN